MKPPTDTTAAVVAGALTVYDAATTTVALGVAGGVELNPLIGALVTGLGLGAGLAVRALLGVALVLVLLRGARDPRSRLGVGPLVAAGSLLGAVAVWNTGQLVLYGPWAVLT